MTSRFRLSASAATSLFLGLLVAAWLLQINYATFQRDLFETGDLAANSLLVQQAKDFTLLVGNYSRLGFNHPGPTFLYVLAVGEWLFHDVLHVAQSPVGGQLMAICLLAGLWTALLLSVTLRLIADAPDAVATCVVLAAVVAALDPEFFGGMWPPHLYGLPFSVYCLSLARLARGGLDCLWVTVLSGGSLVHGHASFAAIAAIPFAGALILFVLQLPGGTFRERMRALQASARNDVRSIAGSLLIGIVLLSPIVINTILNFPGEIPKYVGYGRQSPGNSWKGVLDFVASFWGGRVPLLMGAVLCALLLSSRRIERQNEQIRSSGLREVAIIAVLATIAVSLYAKVGIDDLAHRYTALFYLTVVACVIAFSLVYVLRYSLHRGTLVVGVTLAGVLAFCMATRPVTVESSDAVSHLSVRIQSGAQRMVRLDLDASENWAGVWGMAAGVAAHLVRSGSSEFCIGENWHILFTRALDCRNKPVAATIYRLTAAPSPGAAIIGKFGGFSLVEIGR